MKLRNTDGSMRMDAYYYGFEPTGDEAVDRILSAVACAGKAFHATDQWHDESEWEGHEGTTPVEWIQNAANAAAHQGRIKAVSPDHFQVGRFRVKQKGTAWEVSDKNPRVTFSDLHGALCWAVLADTLDVIPDCDD